MLKESDFVKICVVVPVQNADQIREVLGTNGAGVQGNYEYCSGSYRQVGRFRPLAGANPTLGQIGKLEYVEEEVIETICHKDIVKKVIQAVQRAHPYEEPAIDIFPRYEVK